MTPRSRLRDRLRPRLAGGPAAPTPDPTPRRRVVLLGPSAEVEAPGIVDGDRVLVAPDALAAATGWTFEERRGWCAGERCAPRAGADLEDPGEVADLLGAPRARWDGDAATVVAISNPVDVVAAPLRQGLLPPLAGVDRSGARQPLDLGTGQRRALLFWATWCGCRHDLPAWEALRRDLSASAPGVQLLTIAVDEDPVEVGRWLEGTDLPVVLDPDRTICEALGVVNVPTLLWVDEDDRIVRSHAQVFGDNALIEHHGVDSLPHHDALRRWAAGEEGPPGPVGLPEHLQPGVDAQRARAEFRLGAWLLRHGERGAGEAHLARAGELAPDDLTIRRAAIALTGGDPFGEAFFELYQEWRPRTGGLSYLPPA